MALSLRFIGCIQVIFPDASFPMRHDAGASSVVPTRRSRRPPARNAMRCAWLASVFMLGLAGPAVAEPAQLRLSFQLPLTGTLGVNLVRLKEAVARGTANAVAIEILHGKQAYPDRTVAQSVMAGEIEMAAAAAWATSRSEPAAAAIRGFARAQSTSTTMPS
jgi:hypothetical protein